MLAIEQSKRLVMDFVIAAALLAFYFTGVYALAPGPIQLISLKMILVSLGFMHAHLMGKWAFKKVEWGGDLDALKLMRISLYVVVIYAYSTGG
jgi:hypothetical protein